jgi:hypothetical protein
MGTKAFIATSKDHGLPWAVGYYLFVKNHAINKSTCISTDGVVQCDVFSLSNLLKKINQYASYGDNIILCCHGTPTKLGLSPFKGAPKWMEEEHLDLLASGSEEARIRFGYSEKEWEEFMNDLDKVCQKNLNHIAIRACRIGKNKRFIKKFAKLLFARSVSAPTLRVAYINSDVRQLKSDTDLKELKSHYPMLFEIPTSKPNSKLILGSRKISDSVYDVQMGYDNADTILTFYKDSFPEPVTIMKGQKYAYLHGMVVPEAPHKFYFPLDPRYLSSLTYVDGCLS